MQNKARNTEQGDKIIIHCERYWTMEQTIPHPEAREVIKTNLVSANLYVLEAYM